ncbi:FG-GAP repeat domain-containing protein [Nannocystis punicea]|uniref:VCBS repeat-containing protein n=1 Tax=Nannocystis punicea TaxID=2995304 RepID=A0ABY7HDZ8_9BACT|nr:VCBS repeat-containing protein [Nannocystis poenicansa]WAS97498.1 VCBS repeat-containing protein [Nannocystis poenicansa]
MHPRPLTILTTLVALLPACEFDNKLCIGDCSPLTASDGTGVADTSGTDAPDPSTDPGSTGAPEPSTTTDTAGSSDSSTGTTGEPASCAELLYTWPPTCRDGVDQLGEICFVGSQGGSPGPVITSSLPLQLNGQDGADLLLTYEDDSVVGQHYLFAINTIAEHPWPVSPGAELRLRASGDFDEDGVVDVLAHTHGPDGFSVHALLLDGAGGLADDRIVLVSDGVFTLDAVDWDSDGHLDIVVTITDQPGVDNLVVLLGDGAGMFAATAGPVLADPVPTYTLGALDLDGVRDDFVFVADGSPRIVRHAGGVQTEQGVIQPPELSFHEFEIADLDGDGLGDLVGVATNTGDDNSEIVVYTQANGGFAAGTRHLVNCGASLVAVGDIDRDGWLDIATASAESIIVRRNDGAGGFSQHNLISGISLQAGDPFFITDFAGGGPNSVFGSSGEWYYIATNEP